MKTIFITGASSGIGKASAKLFQSKGWNVIAVLPHIWGNINQFEIISPSYAIDQS